ncbi:O-antigen ligase family protein [Agromyces larvae]|uniref:O-antigen ligase family protein n=1 Tax=Agromyces larvae TaxID=2929802 RepID=A0ABY4BZ95_9MICO|nr:O-antigen ligase family protein [Agromyces larvae]UOE44512.1 O-antigen ligase family protein [Agromyces larvae]
MTSARRSALVGAYATFALFTLLAGQFWRNLLGWWGFGAIAVLVVAGAVALLVVTRPTWIWRRVPKSTFAFLIIATASIAWSAYPGASVLGVAITLATVTVAIALVLCLAWGAIVRALAAAIKWILALSIVFELWAALVVRGPVLPLFPDFEVTDSLPKAFFWSRGLLLQGGPIEGLVGNRNLLAMIALLGLIVFACLLAAGSVRRAQGIGWLVVAALVFALTRSATATLAGVAVLAAVAFAAWARRIDPLARRPLYWTAAAAGAATLALVALGWNTLLQVFGKSDDLTGRFDIWASVWQLITERPWFGWGWVGYWNPWVEPFDGLAVRNGVTYLQAHNAWLDVWLQVGVFGLIAFVSIAVGAQWRSWFLAVDQPRDATGHPIAFSAASLVPLLLLVALLAQSLAESRLLIEGNLALLIMIAWSTKRRQWAHDPLPADAARPRFDVAGPR